MESKQRFGVLVRGDGAVGRSLALALAAQGLQVALLGADEAPRADDVRTYALNAEAVALLKEIKVWEALPPEARTPVYDMAIRGDQDDARLDFSAWQQGRSELAFIVDAAALDQQLAGAVRYSPHIQRVSQPVEAELEAICEGRYSNARAAHGVRFDLKPYEQHGVAARLVASRPHLGLAHQWFRAPEVLALLPFDRPQPEHSFGLVWSVSPERAAELLAMDETSFEAALNEASGEAAGRLKLASARASWPLSLAQASSVSGEGWVLVGDAAHLVHPLAGQGLNLGLADAACLARVLSQREQWRSLGDARLLRRYARERLLPTLAMGQLTDGLQRLFASEAPALRLLRNQGLKALNRLPPLKRLLAGQALGR
ncbi:FAD-dependent monooxygenase [Pelomonas sp. SE-A7]|uniref:FAD-dependent monooxygenase n=1 Tax=Pelomonas sp. SE-A7 TaxID=3054953 RepID=UPI00259D2BBA|nr:FAD-dependent monooxygenase [Pelomonas sp. SE-A7]MDM4767572.1 FAD-dependent monooxygenase [Pelomonas sp. SE-A7]